MIFKATLDNAAEIAALSLQLWSEHTFDELRREFDAFMQADNCAVFLCSEEGQSVGFAQCQLRHDYVEGTSTSPVGYLEGIFVKEAYRGKGIARALLAHCEAWARDKGCLEFASDCELTNEASLKFHIRMGFSEANRVICFTKELK